jgi:signal transduction histidine kinase
VNILVVDDHAVSRRLLRAVLEAEGMHVFDATDGIEALAILAHDRIDAVITDILMPRMDGYRLCHEIRSSENLRTVPILIYSATYTSAQDEKLARQMGADLFLRKPAGAPQMLEALRECLSRPAGHGEPAAPPPELLRMRHYSERLVSKLEERSLELEEARVELREANALLEWRVQRRTEELAAANDQLDSFASFVAHEVRAPLRAISGYVQQLEEDHDATLSAEARRLLGLIADTARHTETLSDALLRFCQLGARPVRRRPVDLNQLVHDVLGRFAREIEARRVTLVRGELPPGDGDPLLLEHVFENLIANALKFTRERPDPRVEIGATAADGSDVLFVRDNGRGFEMRHAHLIFEPFQQLQRHDGLEGTGLGLSLVRNIIVRHGGWIRAEAAPGQGATFFFALTVPGRDPPAEVAPENPL